MLGHAIDDLTLTPRTATVTRDPADKLPGASTLGVGARESASSLPHEAQQRRQRDTHAEQDRTERQRSVGLDKPQQPTLKTSKEVIEGEERTSHNEDAIHYAQRPDHSAPSTDALFKLKL